jgi:hypothetical protein
MGYLVGISRSAVHAQLASFSTTEGTEDTEARRKGRVRTRQGPTLCFFRSGSVTSVTSVVK